MGDHYVKAFNKEEIKRMDKGQIKEVIGIIKLGQIARDVELERAEKHQERAEALTEHIVSTINSLEEVADDLEGEALETALEFLQEVRG